MAQVTEETAMLWTCRLALAVASQDQVEVDAVIAEASQTPEGPTLLLTNLAGTVAALMHDKAGANWRVALAATVDSLREG